MNTERNSMIQEEVREESRQEEKEGKEREKEGIVRIATGLRAGHYHHHD